MLRRVFFGEKLFESEYTPCAKAEPGLHCRVPTNRDRSSLKIWDTCGHKIWDRCVLISRTVPKKRAEEISSALQHSKRITLHALRCSLYRPHYLASLIELLGRVELLDRHLKEQVLHKV